VAEVLKGGFSGTLLVNMQSTALEEKENVPGNGYSCGAVYRVCVLPNLIAVYKSQQNTVLNVFMRPEKSARCTKNGKITMM